MDYLLPENSGVRKAFQDMEAALRENRLTLEAIRVTQSDRDLFNHLISKATAYVAADCMRHANERRLHLDDALTLRRDLYSSRKQLASEQYYHVDMARELSEISGVESDLETDYQAANDHLNLMQTAMRQQEKIGRYQEGSGGAGLPAGRTEWSGGRIRRAAAGERSAVGGGRA